MPSPRLRPLALTIGLGLALGLSACSGDEADPSPSSSSSSPSSSASSSSPSPSTTTSASSAASSASVVVAAVTSAAAPVVDHEAGIRQAVAQYYAIYNQLAQNPDSDVTTITNITLDRATDQTYERLLANRSSGQQQIGPVSGSVLVTMPTGESGVAYLADVCVDTSQAEVLGPDGRSVWRPEDKRQTAAVFTLERRGSSFLITDILYTTDTCSPL